MTRDRGEFYIPIDGLGLAGGSVSPPYEMLGQYARVVESAIALVEEHWAELPEANSDRCIAME